MGIRIALGAERRSVLRLTVGGSMRPVVLGVGVGIGGTFLLGRVLAGMVYEVQPTDPLSLAGAALTMLGVAIFASWIPARRATHVDPVLTMRAE